MTFRPILLWFIAIQSWYNRFEDVTDDQMEHSCLWCGVRQACSCRCFLCEERPRLGTIHWINWKEKRDFKYCIHSILGSTIFSATRRQLLVVFLLLKVLLLSLSLNVITIIFIGIITIIMSLCCRCCCGCGCGCRWGCGFGCGCGGGCCCCRLSFLDFDLSSRMASTYARPYYTSVHISDSNQYNFNREELFV